MDISLCTQNGTANIHVDIKKNYLQHIGGTPINDEMNAILTESRKNTSNPTLFSQNIYRIVTSIPHTILFAPDGTILARGLHGEDIEKKLTEVFSNKK